MNRVFVLSPANCNGVRAQWLLRRTGGSDLAQRLRTDGAPLGEVFSFLSALYFRGKLAYAQAFCRPPFDCPGIFIITPSDGLVPHDTLIRLPKLRRFARVPIHVDNPVYYSSLQRSAKKLASGMGSECEVVLLGSLASRKYLEILHPIFGSRLMVPDEFIGRGDMSRGGLLLRHVREHRELNYIDGTILTAAKINRFSTRQQIRESSTATLEGDAPSQSQTAKEVTLRGGICGGSQTTKRG
jgi:hypothetical protein